MLSCEFLSIWYFYRSSFNLFYRQYFNYNVVSSFQFGIFTEVLSTNVVENLRHWELWVPFNLVFLPKFFQLRYIMKIMFNSCEFLSIWYFYRSSFNSWKFWKSKRYVVSSFQFGIFTEVLSTKILFTRLGRRLWVPFNLVFLPKFFQR